MRLIPFKKQQNELLPSWQLFDDFVDKFFNDDYISDSRLMAIDVLENDKEFTIKANLPGVKKEDINITMKENQLILEANTEEKKVENYENMIRSERYIGKYQRLITLPDNCDKDNIKAKLENGVLNLVILKKEPTPKKKISID